MKNKSLVLLSALALGTLTAIVGCKSGPTPLQETAIHHAAKAVTSNVLQFKPQYLPEFQTAADQLLAISSPTNTTITPAQIQTIIGELGLGGKIASINAVNLSDAESVLANMVGTSTNLAALRTIAGDAGRGMDDGILLWQTSK